MKLQAETLHQLLLFEEQEKEHMQNVEATSHSIIALYEKYIRIRSMTGGLAIEDYVLRTSELVIFITQN